MSSNRGRKRDRQRIQLAERPSENPACELSEIDIYKTQSITEDDFCIGLIARFGSISISCENWSYSVSTTVKEAFVQLSTSNCSIARDGRYGDERRPLEAPTEVKIKSSFSEKDNVGGGGKLDAGIGPTGFKFPTLGLNLAAQASRSSEIVTSETQKLLEISRSIAALAGNKWKISDLIHMNLQGKYEPPEHLCKVSVSPDTQSGHVTASMFFYPKDLSLEIQENDTSLAGRLFKERPSNIAVAKALLAKHLRDLNARPSENERSLDGRIVVGKSQIEYKISSDEH